MLHETEKKTITDHTKSLLRIHWGSRTHEKEKTPPYTIQKSNK